jgi:hypothetical protein
MKNAVFWDVESCKSCVNRRFGQAYRLHLQGRKIREIGFFYPEDGGDTFVQNGGSQKLQGATSQKTVFFEKIRDRRTEWHENVSHR